MCEVKGCKEYAMICLNGQQFICWKHYCEAMQRARAAVQPGGSL